MHKIRNFLLVVALIAGSCWVWFNGETVMDTIGSYVDNGEFLTLEARFTPEQIMEAHRNELIADASREYKNPSLKFYPYLLMEVKYTQADKNTREGVILWSMVDGEMVLNTDEWETTHGFEDAIRANASRTDFKIMNALARNRGSLSREQLQSVLGVDVETLNRWVDHVQQKQLVAQRENEVKLHFQNPKILVSPQTKINQWLVTKPYNHAQRIGKKYSRGQISRVAEAAFGHDFVVRDAKVVFLPVYSIDILNPDGSLHTSHWNALNGQRIKTKLLAHLS